ncbi:MAG TPA: ABC transporter permease [Firmicutes bacterium]|nr:ABC transporter permease [Bacillota bacterium]
MSFTPGVIPGEPSSVTDRPGRSGHGGAFPNARSMFVTLGLAIVRERPWFLFVSLLILIFVLAISVNGFFTIYNMLNMSKYSVEIGLLALAETLVITSGGGGIDLSVGSMLSLVCVIIGHLAIKLGINIWAAAFAGIIAGFLLGCINGILISTVRIPPFIVTLGTMYAYRSLALVITGGIPISGFPPSYYALGQGSIMGIPFQVLIIFIPVIIILNYTLTRTLFGRYLYGVGSNELAAKFAAINIKKVRVWVYILSGLLAGIAAVVMTSRVATAKPDAGFGYELQAITIAVLGGTSVAGGRGTIAGTVLAALTLTVLYNGLDLAGIHPIWQVGTLGLVLIISVLLNNWLLRSKE